MLPRILAGWRPVLVAFDASTAHGAVAEPQSVSGLWPLAMIMLVAMLLLAFKFMKPNAKPPERTGMAEEVITKISVTEFTTKRASPPEWE